MSVSLKIRVVGSDAVSRALADMEGRVTDMTPLMQAIAASVEKQTKDRIVSIKEGPDREYWPDWTKRYRETRHSQHSFLEGWGHLRDTVVGDADADSAVVGSNLVYAAIHQFGGSDNMPPGPAGIPPRPYIGISDENELEILEIIEEYMMRGRT